MNGFFDRLVVLVPKIKTGIQLASVIGIAILFVLYKFLGIIDGLTLILLGAIFLVLLLVAISFNALSLLNKEHRTVAFKYSIISATILIFLLLVLALTHMIFDSNQLSRIEESVKDYTEFEKKYLNVIAHYKNQEYEMAELAAREAFNLGNRIIEPDELHGYLIASYNGLEDYEEAIIEILKRDQLKSVNNYSLVYDLAWTIRAYAIKHDVLATHKLIQELKATYGDKILSHIWVYMPNGIMEKLKEGKYLVPGLIYDINTKGINSVIELYPDDNYLDWGCYLLGEYEQALTFNPNSLIKEILYFGINKRRVEEFKAKSKTIYLVDSSDYNHPNKFLRKNSYDSCTIPFTESITSNTKYYLSQLECEERISNKNLLNEDISELRKIADSYEYFIEKFPSSEQLVNVHSELIWIYDVLNEKEKLGLSLENASIGCKCSFIRDFPKKLGKKDLISLIESEYSYGNQIDLLKVLTFKLGSSFTLALLENPSFDELKKIYAQYLLEYEFYHFSFEKAIEIADYLRGSSVDISDYTTIEILDMIDLIETLLVEYDKNDFVSDLLVLKKKGDCLVTLNLIDIGINRFKHHSKTLGYLFYLKTRCLTNNFPNRIDCVISQAEDKAPQSEYLDDIYAEQVYAQAWYYGPEKAEPYLEQLITRFPTHNALDNAYNWMASIYTFWCKKCKRNCRDNCNIYCSRASEINNHIISKYSTKRFSAYSVKRLLDIKVADCYDD